MTMILEAMIDLDELQLAARNHGMPLELLREPITPAGLHYLLIHFDIPHVDAETWRLEIGGLVRQPLELSLADLRARPARTLAVTLECAGNGRALIPDHNPSQPWLREAVGTAEWTGTPLAPILEEAGVAGVGPQPRLHGSRPRHPGRDRARLRAEPQRSTRRSATTSCSRTR